MPRREAFDQPERSAADIAASRAARERLLGRNPLPEDQRDHRMIDKLRADPVSDAQLNMTLRDLLAGGFFANWKDILAFWRWIKARKPPKVRRSKRWADKFQLDQGQTPHCVGFAWAQWSNSEPVDGNYTNSDGDAIYYECKAIDGEPGAENGSDTRSGAKAMQNRGRLGEYVFANSVAEIIAWVLTKGPLPTGSDWDGPMFDIDRNGYLHPNGNPEGGHEWLIEGYDDGDKDDPIDKEPFFWMQNSWGLSWGIQGGAKITVREYAQLWKRGADAAAGLELS